MMDFTSTKVLVPAALFFALSPGILLSLPSLSVHSMTSSLRAIFLHALVLVVLYWAIVKSGLLRTTITRADLIVPAILFVLLSPHVSQVTYPRVAISTALFIVIFTILRSKFPQYY